MKTRDGVWIEGIDKSIHLADFSSFIKVEARVIVGVILGRRDQVIGKAAAVQGPPKFSGVPPRPHSLIGRGQNVGERTNSFCFYVSERDLQFFLQDPSQFAYELRPGNSPHTPLTRFLYFKQHLMPLLSWAFTLPHFYASDEVGVVGR
jgi:hypothetical protein